MLLSPKSRSWLHTHPTAQAALVHVLGSKGSAKVCLHFNPIMLFLARAQLKDCCCCVTGFPLKLD